MIGSGDASKPIWHALLSPAQLTRAQFTPSAWTSHRTTIRFDCFLLYLGPISTECCGDFSKSAKIGKPSPVRSQSGKPMFSNSGFPVFFKALLSQPATRIINQTPLIKRVQSHRVMYLGTRKIMREDEYNETRKEIIATKGGAVWSAFLSVSISAGVNDFSTLLIFCENQLLDFPKNRFAIYDSFKTLATSAAFKSSIFESIGLISCSLFIFLIISPRISRED